MAELGPVELPVTLTVGDPVRGAEPTHLGSVHLTMRFDGELHGAAVQLVPVDPADFARQLAALLGRHAAELRAEHEPEQGVPGAAAR